MTTPTSPKPNFASDNWAPMHPRVLEALASVNEDSVVSYGDDRHTEEAAALLRHHFGDNAIPYLVLTGTGANVLALGTCLKPWEAVITPSSSHIHQNETGAPEFQLRARLIAVETPDGKLTPEAMKAELRGIGNEHRVQPKVVSITQATEYGTVYTPDEVRALCDAAHERGLYVHMDGARISNAAAALDLDLAAVSSACGIDVMSFGATKNGAAFAEAVIFFRDDLAEGFKYRRKQGLQLASKMRFVAAQVLGLFGDDTWRDNARHANAMAARLGAGLSAIDGIRVTQRVESNQVFATISAEQAARVESCASVHLRTPETSEYRFVTSWNTTVEEVDRFIDALTSR